MKTSEHKGALARVTGAVLLWALAVVGAVSGLLWAGNTAGLVQPLIVVSGSMSPEINTGDLLFSTPTPAGDLSVGDVVTVHSPHGDVLVTHRIVELDRSGDTVTIRLKGDANTAADGEQHVLSVTDPVWTPQLTIPGAGYIVEGLMRPAVAIPLVIGLLALVALTQMQDRRADEPGDPHEIPAAEPAQKKEEVLV